jgi:recombinational DNA repair protein (RecF pathway)
MVFEGIVTHKVLYKERDLIVKLLLRNGLVGSFYVYGGQGGGKNHKPTLFELGSMMKVMVKEARVQRIEGSELMISAEHQRTWNAELIRHDIQAFYLTCLYFEILNKVAQSFQHGVSSYDHVENDGLFSVLSNALFHLEIALEQKSFLPEQHLNLFLIKLIFHLGIMPDTDTCSYCSTSLMESPSVNFISSGGHFSCQNCSIAENEKGFLLRIKYGYQTKYKDYAQFTGSSFHEADKLIQFFCHQFQLKPMELKSYKLLFK